MVEHNEFHPCVGRTIAEHGRLHEILREARARLANLAGPDPDAPFNDMAEIFQAVRSQLQRHFMEEEGGHLNAVVS